MCDTLYAMLSSERVVGSLISHYSFIALNKPPEVLLLLMGWNVTGERCEPKEISCFRCETRTSWNPVTSMSLVSSLRRICVTYLETEFMRSIRSLLFYVAVPNLSSNLSSVRYLFSSAPVYFIFTPVYFHPPGLVCPVYSVFLCLPLNPLVPHSLHVCLQGRTNHTSEWTNCCKSDVGNCSSSPVSHQWFLPHPAHITQTKHTHTELEQ